MSKNRDPIYLDHNATTPVLPEVVDAMLPYLREHFGNPSSNHVYGQRTRDAVAAARQQVAKLLGCRSEEIFFVSGGTEANNLAIRGAAAARPERRHIVTSVIEHPATEMPCRFLESRGYSIVRVGVDGHGMVLDAAMEAAPGPDTALVSVMHANSETGTIQPIRVMADAAHAAGALVHTDAAQSTGKIPFTVDELGIDLLSVVGHKMYAPKGIGALYVREGIELAPQLLGGGHEQGLRPGTENVPYIVGLGKACEIASRDVLAEAERIAGLRDRLWELLKAEIPDLQLNGHPELRLPNTLNVRFPGVSGNAILANAPRIAASTGSACHAEDESASAVIRAMGHSEEEAIGSVRLTLGRLTRPADIEASARALKRAWLATR
ncbi:MAG: aminotransferase class V-fold PLP-dependent enzyme [Xanthomonadales bacterium]|nr:cysteine desulfurase [Xanthomonadales bacterium]NIX13502.1 aminotransferase class V-fold PLP-dependent enzyme [Xanthomonadales bacterium]